MSLTSLLSIARTALLAQRRAMEVTAHNIANANTPGYSRQRLELTAADPLRLPLGAVGRGVTFDTIVRLRDTFYDASYRRDNAGLGGSSTRLSLLQEIEGAIGEPSDTGIAAALDGFFQSFSDLTHDPSGAAARELVRQAGDRLAGAIRSLDGRIAQSGTGALERLQSDVNDVNGLLSRVASLNTQIIAAGGERAPDLLDQRDLLLDQLSEFATLKVLPQSNGTVTVIAANTTLVDAATAQTLQVAPAATGFNVTTSDGRVLDFGEGRLQSETNFLTTDLPAVRAKLDQFVSGLVNSVNGLHGSGFTLTGATGIAFFDPAGVTAGSIDLSAAVKASTDAIAAGLTNAPGDATLALQLAQLRNVSVGSLGNRTLGDFYAVFASGVGADTRDATLDVESLQALVDHAETQRLSVSGVATDEEMLSLIAQQEAYGAAARLIQAAQEMSDAILRIL